MEKRSVDFLAQVTDAMSPSGYEEDAASIWKKRTKAYADKVRGDVHGNSIAVLNEGKAPKIMLAGHIDEVGYMIKYIDSDGFLYFSTIGGIDPHIMPGQRVWIQTKKGRISGVIGRKPPHHLEPEERRKISKLEQLWMDIGAKTEDQAKGMVEIGDIAVPAVGFQVLRGDRAIGRGFDDKAGAFVVSEVLRMLSQKKINASVYGVATVQEEIGLRGARTSAYEISPDIGIAVDVSFTTDIPGMDKKRVGDIKLGGGPVIARGPNIQPKIFEMLVKTATKEKIPYQIQGISRGTGTDANVIQLTRSGVATGLVGIPLRYGHTPVELLSLNDLENVSRLLTATIRNLSNKK